VEAIAPRSVFAPAVTTDWVDEEMDGVELGRARKSPGAGEAQVETARKNSVGVTIPPGKDGHHRKRVLRSRSRGRHEA
jgi:hypothetical protein